jgi:DNA modification methylase
MKHAILLKPNSNVPYFEAMKKMCLYEITIILEQLDINFDGLEVKSLGRGYCLQFETYDELDKSFQQHIEKLSFYYAYFEVCEDMLKPIQSDGHPYFGYDLSNRLKYAGKTNEAFTSMMLNLAVYTSKFYLEPVLNIFDPVCGRGTTLFEAMIRGHHAYGTELNKKSVNELGQYFQRYLQEGKYKHALVRGKALVNKKTIGETFEAVIGESKEEVKKKTGKIMKVLRGDTTESHWYFKKQSMHVIVADLPNAVQPLSKHDEGEVIDLDELLNRSFKSWYQLLKKGGAIALSWNTYINTRDELIDKLTAYGFTVIDDDNYLKFDHRVSQAMNRDIIVAIKN